ncbi:MAG: hypothetical protein LBM18_00875 [Oscillospiraceae bacterium]|jgi:hypothetical protein|nr:hypothetical protein [Oscillospiraceae bacterium]
MAELIDLAVEYRASGERCKSVLRQLKSRLKNGQLRSEEELELRRRITLVTAMARECLATANYLRRYHERRQSNE